MTFTVKSFNCITDEVRVHGGGLSAAAARALISALESRRENYRWVYVTVCDAAEGKVD